MAQGPCIVAAMWVGFVLCVAAGLAAGSSVATPAACPVEQDVEAELARLGAERGARPEITVVGDRMRVVLRDHDGATVGSREVEAPVACHERATVAAVLVATWMGIWPEAAKASSPAHATAGDSAPLNPATLSTPAAKSPADFGLAVLGAHDGNAFALGFALSANLAVAGRLRAFVAASATTERERKFDHATAGYTRPALEAGPALRFGGGRVSGDIGLSGRLGILVVRGKGLSENHSATHLTPGVGAQARVQMARRSFAPFAYAAGTYWLDQQTLTLDDPGAARSQLPRWDVAVGLGVLWALGW
jgi:hypothetical protein